MSADRHSPPASLHEACSALRTGSWSAEGLCEWALDRAAGTAALNAFVELDRDGALAQARSIDRQRKEPPPVGTAGLSELAGIPLAHKDLFQRVERSPGCGSRVQLPAQARGDAAVLARLRQAGSVDLGLLHLSEFAYGPTGHNAWLGPARNPWQTTRVTGGSSSGSAVAVACGAVYASLGSDSGGSIRTPASWCGVSGLKPTRGRLPVAGMIPLSPTMDTVGVMARSADDLALVFAELVADDPQARGDWEAALRESVTRTSIRLGVVDAWFHDDLSDAVAEGLDQARALWSARLGARIVAATMPDLPAITHHARIVLLHEAWLSHRNLIEAQDTRYAPPVLARLLAGSEIDHAEYQQALDPLPRLVQGVLETSFGDADVLLLPCNPGTAPAIDATDPATLGSPAPTILRQVDAITRCLRPFNYLGLPALALPAGQDGEGLPFGLQLVGRPGREAELLSLGMRWQQATDWHQRRPPGFALA